MNSSSSRHDRLPAPARQTLSYLQRRLAEMGIRPRTQHGQNFLIDHNLLRVLHDAAQVGPHDVVLEVGTGTGALTMLVARSAAHVVSVEIDPHLAQLAREELEGFGNVTLLQQDALRTKNRLDEKVLEAVAAQRAVSSERQFKLVANLPYNVATPILTNLLALDDPPVSMTVTIQKELADRILARPSTKDYGALSVWVQCQCTARVVRTLPPEVFWPRPKVSSAIVHIALDRQRRAAIGDREFFHQFVRAVFLHRRKYLRSAVRSAFPQQPTMQQVDAALQAAGIDGSCRAEQLDVAALLRLCEALRQQLFPEMARLDEAP
jgi:16S rRNA (adenine1518-N6/adenine1519-N6)-dimethyltransferase